MKTPKEINTLSLIATCEGIKMEKWRKLMKGTTKANGKQIRLLIKKHLPTLYQELGLNFHNPYEHRSVKKDGLLVYCHSAIEYFFKYN